MFGRKKVVLNEFFGEVVYWAVKWQSTTKTQITLWNRTYDIDLCAVSESKKENINKNQEKAYKNFKETIIERQREIERTVEQYYNTQDKQVLISKFTPSELIISRSGECALLADNADDDDSHDPPMGLAITISPELNIYTQEDYDGYIYGGGSL